MKFFRALGLMLLLASFNSPAFALFTSDFLNAHPMEVVGQNGTDCAPASLFNSMQMSPSLSAALKKLPGQAPWDRYSFFLKKYGSRPSVFFSRGSRYNSEIGTEIHDLAEMGNDLIGARELQAVSGARHEGEPGGSLLPRIFGDFRASFEAGFAPVVYIGFRSADGKLLGGHAVILIDEPARELNVYDSRDFSTTAMQAREDTSHSFFAWVQERPEDMTSPTADWNRYAIHNAGGQPVISPLVFVSGPGLWPENLPAGIMTIESYLILRPR